MSGATGLDRLLDRSTWIVSRSVCGILVTSIDVEEARLVASSAPVRAALERYLMARRTEDPSMTGLLMFIDQAGTRIGFVELACDDDAALTWNGPNGPLGPLFP